MMKFRENDSADLIVADALAQAGKSFVMIETVLTMLQLPDSQRAVDALREVAMLIATKVQQLNPEGWARATQETEDQIRRESGDAAADDFKRRRAVKDASEVAAISSGQALLPKIDSN